MNVVTYFTYFIIVIVILGGSIFVLAITIVKKTLGEIRGGDTVRGRKRRGFSLKQNSRVMKTVCRICYLPR